MVLLIDETVRCYTRRAYKPKVVINNKALIERLNYEYNKAKLYQEVGA